MIARYRDGAVPGGRRSTRRSPATSTASPSASPSCIDRVELTPALDEIWQRVRRLNRYVEEQAPWQLAKDAARAGDLDRVLRTLAEGLRVVTVLLHPWLPGDAPRSCSTPSARPTSRSPARALGAGALGAVGALEPLFPKHPPAAARDRQPHAPRLAARRPTPSSSPRRARGGRHAHPHRRHGRARRCRTRARGRRGLPAGATPPIGRHPNHADGLRRRRPGRPRRRWPAHARCAAIGETGLDYFRDYAPRADQERAFHAQIELARATGKPLVIHTRAAEDDTLATLRERADGLARGPALLLDARPPRRVPRPRAGGSRSPATSPTRRPATSPTRPSACPTTACWSRPTRRTSRRSGAQGAQPAGLRRPHRALRGRAPRRRLRGARAPRRRATPPTLFGW